MTTISYKRINTHNLNLFYLEGSKSVGEASKQLTAHFGLKRTRLIPYSLSNKYEIDVDMDDVEGYMALIIDGSKSRIQILNPEDNTTVLIW